MERIRELPRIKPVTLDFEAIRKTLEALPPPDRNRGTQWTPEMDALLLEFWPIKDKRDVAEVFQLSEATLRQRYRTLTEPKP